MSALFEVALERAVVPAGGTVRGSVRFGMPRAPELEKVKKVMLTVSARVHGSGNTEEVVAWEQVLAVGPITAAQFPFSAQLPEAPVSHAGRYVKIDWQVRVELDIPWAVDPKATAHFQVVPRGREAMG